MTEKKMGQRKEEKETQEELEKRGRRIRREEEEEEMEMDEYHRRVEYMFGHCSERDQDICGLLEEKRGMLNSLKMIHWEDICLGIYNVQ